MRMTSKIFYAHDILKEFKGHNAVKNVLRRDDLSVLDIGCGLPRTLLSLYQVYNFKKLVGVDEEVESKLVTEKLSAHVPKTVNSVYLLFQRGIKKEKRKIRKGKYLSKSAFQNRFQLHFETDILSYFHYSKPDDFFDYIVLSNILHLVDEDEIGIIFSNAVAKLKRGGLIFVRVTHEENPNTKPPNNHTGFNEASFLKLFTGFKKIDAYQYKKEDEEYVQSITYFGVKE